MEAIDANQSKAINGDEGGTWAPSSPIVVGGSGMEITGDLDVSGAATFTGGVTADEIAVTGDLTVQTNATIQGYLTAETDTEVQGALEVTGATTLNGGATVTGGDLSVALNLAVQGNVVITSDLTADGASVETLGIHSAVAPGEVFTADGAGSFTGALEVGGATTLTGAVSIAQPVTPTGSGRVRVKAILGADADTTYNAADAQCVHIPSSSSNTTRTYTIDTTGAADGDRISFSTDKVSKTVVLDVLGSNPLTENLHGSTTGAFRSLELTYIGTGWYITSGTRNP